MDGQQEPVRYKSNLLFGLESDSVPVSLLTFSTGLEKVKSPKGRNTKLINIKVTGQAQTREKRINQKLCIPTGTTVSYTQI